MAIQPPTFSIQFHALAPDLLRADVTVQHLPENFLGAAFDLVIDGGKIDLRDHGVGAVFPRRDDVLYLASLRQQPQRIVFGVSVKGGKVFQPGDGILASFYFQHEVHEELSFRFDHGVLSIFENGRKDLAKVAWNDATFVADQISAPTVMMSVDPVSSQQLFQASTLTTNDFDPLIQVYGLLGLFLVIALAVFALVALVLKGRGVSRR